MIEQSEVNSILKQYLESHGLDVASEDEWFLPNGTLPAIRCIWYEYPDSEVGRLDVHVLLEKDVILEESFAGMGTGIDGLKDGFQNFSVNSLHVILAAFWDEIDPKQVVTEEWNIGSDTYTAYLGNFGTKGANGVHPSVPEETFSCIESTIKESNLESEVTWIRNFYCNIGDGNIVYESLFNNNTWEEGIEALKGIHWPKSESYYSVRNFMILKKRTHNKVEHNRVSRWTRSFVARLCQRRYTRS